MPRNSSGTYSLPSGNPVVSNTLIQSTWANNTCSDLGSSITDSLDRNGRGAMLAALKNVDGTAVAPSITFSSEGTLGLYRVAAGVLGFAAGGALVLSIASTGLTFTTPLVLPLGSNTAPSLTFTGNTNTGWYSPATNQVAVTTNGVQALLIDAAGAATLRGSQITFSSTGVHNITASDAAGALVLQTGGANTRLTVDAAGLVTVANFLGVGKSPTSLIDAASTPAASSVSALQITNFQSSTTASLSATGTTFSSGGAGASSVLLTTGTGNTNLALGPLGAGSGVIQFIVNNSERMRLDASGNLTVETGTLTLSPTTSFIGHNSTTGNLAIGASATLVDGVARIELYDTAHATLAKQVNYRADVHTWTKSTAATPYMAITSAGSLVVGSSLTSTFDFAGRAVIEASGASGALLGMTVAGSSAGYLLADGTSLTINNAGSGSMAFATGGATRLTISSGGVITDGAGNELGYKSLPQIVATGGYTALVTDKGKGIVVNSGNVTIPASVFTAGDVVTVYNNSGGLITIVQGSGLTLRFGTSSAAGGNRTLGNNGITTVFFINGTFASISGTNLT